MFMDMNEVIAQINALAKKAKQGPLTPEELEIFDRMLETIAKELMPECQ